MLHWVENRRMEFSVGTDGAQVPLGTRSPSGWSSGIKRSGLL